MSEDMKIAADLEWMVDRLGLEKVVALLAQIAGEKAEHVASNWQDTTLATVWRTNARRIEAVRILTIS